VRVADETVSFEASARSATVAGSTGTGDDAAMNLPDQLVIRVSAATWEIRASNGATFPLPKTITTLGKLFELGYELVSMCPVVASEKDSLAVALRKIP
jgi:hypothetical protein